MNLHSDYYTNLDLNYSDEKLIRESTGIKYKPFESGRNRGTWFDYAPTWLQGRVFDTRPYEEIDRLTNLLREKAELEEIRPRFYKQEKNTEVPMHADHNTLCCVNIILSETAAPIVFEDIGEIHYRCALINITRRHMVPKFNTERLLLKFSIFDKTYEEVKARLNELSSH